MDSSSTVGLSGGGPRGGLLRLRCRGGSAAVGRKEGVFEEFCADLVVSTVLKGPEREL